MPEGAELPFVSINVAMTADGKIAPEDRRYIPFGSPRDRQRMMELRARSDAVIAGARTVDSFPANLGPGGLKYRLMRQKNGLREYNLRVIASGAGTVAPEAEIFKRRFSPIIVLAGGRAPEARLRRLRPICEDVKTFGADELDFRAALQWLRQKWDVKHLLCEGGGELNAALFRAGLVNEVYATICPALFGGRSAPTLADGPGAMRLADGCRLKLKSMQRVGDEIFLHYSVQERAGGGLTGSS